MVPVIPLQDGARFVANADDFVVALGRIVGSDAFGDTGVCGAAEAAVRGDGHQQLAGVRCRLLGTDLRRLVKRLRYTHTSTRHCHTNQR